MGIVFSEDRMNFISSDPRLNKEGSRKIETRKDDTFYAMERKE